MAAERPTVICVQEHWFEGDNADLIRLDGYIVGDIYCRRRLSHGGTLVFVKDGASVKIKKLQCSKLSTDGDFECSAIKMQIESFKCCIVSIYRSPTGCIETFFDKLNETVVCCQKSAFHIFICGDLNIDFLTDSKEKQLLDDFMCNFDLCSMSNEPTRVCVNKNGRVSSSKIDYILTNVNSYSESENVIQPNLGDHLAVIHTLNLEINSLTDERVIFKFRDASEFNIQKLYFSIKSVDFNYLRWHHDINIAYKEFIELLTHVIDRNCPMKTIRRRVDNNDKGWVNREVIAAGDSLKNKFWLMRHNGFSVDARDMYNAAKKDYKQLIDYTKRTYYSRIIGGAINKQKTVWAVVNSQLGRKKSKHSAHIVLRDKGEDITDTELIADKFVQYFATAAADRIRQNFGAGVSTGCTVGGSFDKTFFFWPVRVGEVEQVIRNLKNTGCCGPDGIQTKIIKSICDLISGPLVHLINLSVSTGTFPALLKVSSVIPVYKKDDPASLTSYRPISILNINLRYLSEWCTTELDCLWRSSS